MTRELVEIQPTELKFIFELNKQSSCSIQLVNTSGQYVAYKVKTTKPKGYCVRPNVGVISPNSPCEIIVTMQSPRNSQADKQCRDKFLIQSTVVKEGTTTDQISSDLFAKDNGRVIEEKKLKVTLISPPHSPVLHPIEDLITHQAVYEADSPVLQPINIIKKAEAIYEASSPVPQPLDSVKGQEVVYEARSPVSQPFDGAKNQEVVYEVLSPVCQPQAHSPVLQLIDGGMKEKPAFEASKPRERVRSFTGSSSPQPFQTVEKDVVELRAKLNEAEKMITSLREERNAIIQQWDAFGHELMLDKRKRMSQVPVGYPFLFVCFTAFLGLVVGYILHS